MKKFLKKIKNRKRNSKGFTLVELIITVAIMSVILAMILGMMTSSSNFYERSNSMMRVSYSLQETMSQIKETVIDCSCAVKFDTSTSPNEFIIVNKNIDAAGTIVDYTACAYRYDPAAQTLMYGETKFTSPTDTSLPGKIKCDSLLAIDVTDFQWAPLTVYLDEETGLSKIRSMHFSVTVQKNGRSDTAVETVALRNNPLQVTSYDQIPVE